MSKYRMHYIDLRPAPLEPAPSTLAIYIGAAAMLVVLYIITIVLFTI